VERLAALAKETAARVEPQRTLRWNVRPPAELTLLSELLSRYSQLKPAAQTQARTCLQRVGLSPSGRDSSVTPLAVESARAKLYDVSDDDWDKSCIFTADAVDADIAAFSARTADLRRLRAAVGLRDDEKLVNAGRSCGPL
jgi:hypothetical protein